MRLRVDRRTPLRLVLALAAAACAALSVAVIDRVPATRTLIQPPEWVSPTAYLPQPDNPMPTRARVLMVPNQFDAVKAPSRMIGTRVPNLVVRAGGVEQHVGPAIVWSASFRTLPRWNGRVTVPAIAALVAHSPHPDWLRATEPGVYLLSVGLEQAPGTRLEVVAPEVRELRLAMRPQVYLSGVGAQALFRNVKVTSWVPETGTPALDPNGLRPFVSYHLGGRLDILNCEFSYLGTDTSRGYGVSWGIGTTGSALGSLFHHNLFGSYTGGAVGVVFRGNVYRDNARYGLDPHTDSSGLVVVGNEAYGNNTHGIIFSNRVTRSVVEGNRSHDNGANGIMMDARSDANVLRDNDVRNNRGDGIVVQGSSNTEVSGNTVTGSAVAIRINANRLGPTDGTRVLGNDIRGNQDGIQVYGGARGTLTQGNRITDTADQAIDFKDPGTSQSDTVSGALKAVVAQRDATVRALRTSDVGRGVVVEHNARVTVESSRLTGGDIAVDVQPGSHLDLVGTGSGGASTVSSARNAVVVSGTAVLRDVAIQDVQRGVLVDPQGRVSITGSSIVTDGKGLEVQGADPGRLQVSTSEISARKPLVGSTDEGSGNRLTLLPSWLAVAGAVFIVLAVALHVGHRTLVRRRA